MRFNSVLISSFLLVPAGLVDCHHMDRRSRGAERLTNVPSRRTIVKKTPNWAGAVWEMNEGTFYSVEGTFKVPKISGPNGYGAAAWVGIDGDGCTDTFLRTGVQFTVTPSGSFYHAWYEWSPTLPRFESYSKPVPISAGNIVRLVVIAPKTTAAYVMIHNISNNQSAIQHLNSTVALCGQDAGWIVEDYLLDGAYVPLVDFGTVTFANATASLNAGGTYGPQGATIFDIVDSGQFMDVVWVAEDSITVNYTVHPAS